MHHLSQRLAKYNLQAQSSSPPAFEWPAAKNDFTFLNGYVLKGYVGTYTIAWILPVGSPIL